MIHKALNRFIFHILLIQCTNKTLNINQGFMQDKIIATMPVTHVLVDTWMLTVKLVYKLSNVSDYLKWTTSTRDTIYTHFQGMTNNIYAFGRSFFAPSFFTRPPMSTRPYSFLPVQMMGGRVSIHKAMTLIVDGNMPWYVVMWILHFFHFIIHVNIAFFFSFHYLHCICISGCLCKFSATPRSRELRGLTVKVTSEIGRDWIAREHWSLGLACYHRQCRCLWINMWETRPTVHVEIG